VKVLLGEFRDFAIKGNVLDLAVGVIIGAAFSSVVGSLVNDVLMPPIGRLTGNVDFKELFLALNGQHYATLAAAKAAGAPTLNYGAFVNSVVNFLIVAAVIFVLVKQITRFQKLSKVTGATSSVKKCRFCASKIAVEAVRCPHCTSNLEPENVGWAGQTPGAVSGSTVGTR
jgi:large conductance mechanosensitive channel